MAPLPSAAERSEQRIDLPYGMWSEETLSRTVTVRPLDGWDEARFCEALDGGLAAVRVATDCIATCVSRNGQELGLVAAASLTVGDREVLLRAIYALTVSPTFSAVAHCIGECGGAAEFDIDLRELTRPVPEAGPVHRIQLGRKRIVIRLPTGADIERAVRSNQGSDQLLAGCVDHPVQSLAPIAAAIERLDPNAECEIAVQCPECAAPLCYYLDGFALLEAALRSEGGIFGQIDLLARTYGWAESAILSLPRRRRLRYCRLAGAETIT